ncbi:VWA domain-containing protein [Bifidobacterium sp. ESL0763]|uniref:VWA domain-containing protein n=1 Tax=Bifidobacterium sp. ESL0763 TaxID=2983227 RepID=UPI0023F64F58|nr:VWA domain-containing protein [Bifidobacterium sp. ESL0763]MDF7663660.1 VWA domain-containing protein [Bifidobacterium sp. ESL0763]
MNLETNLQWRWPWIGLVAALAALAVVIAMVVVSARRKGRRTLLPVFGMDDELNTERISARFHQWRLLGRFAVAALAVALALSVAMVARPSTIDEGDERASNRDIVLCMDVSPSMLSYDHQVLETYRHLVDNFKGERIGLSLFNSTSRTLFPLTDDYDLASGQLKKASDILGKVSSQDKIDKLDSRTSQDFSDLIEGTQNRKDMTSLIGDGLVSCAAMLPGFTYGTARKGTDASKRSIVLATDNISGKSTYTLGSALDLTRKAGITVDGLYAGDKSQENDKTTLDMRREITSHGGEYSSVHSGQSVDRLVRDIERRKSRAERQNRRAALVDAPGWWTLALAVALAAWLGLAWRLRR